MSRLDDLLTVHEPDGDTYRFTFEVVDQYDVDLMLGDQARGRIPVWFMERIARLSDRADELTDGLRKFGEHRDTCKRAALADVGLDSFDSDCDCGLQATIEGTL